MENIVGGRTLTKWQRSGRLTNSTSGVRAWTSTELAFPPGARAPALPTQRSVFFARHRDSITLALEFGVAW